MWFCWMEGNRLCKKQLNMIDLRILKIAFYGASVTQQRHGFVEHFSKMVHKKVLKFGFGGMHLPDAGICFVDKVADLKPDICFIDWFSTWYANQDGKFNLYLDAITEKLQKTGCRVIFLFLPNNRGLEECDVAQFYTVAKSYLKNKKIEFIPLDEILANHAVTDLLRDSIHTTPEGSQLYAENILKYLENTEALPKAEIEPNIYSAVSVLPVKRCFNKEVVLEGKCHIQGFFLKIGPWSGIVKVNSGTVSFNENTWDQWCYYGRDHFSFNLPVEGKAVFTLSDETFDTTPCKEHFDFSKQKKKLVIHEIYYYGKYLKICTKGSKTAYLYTLLMSKIYAAKHRLTLIFKNIAKKS